MDSTEFTVNDIAGIKYREFGQKRYFWTGMIIRFYTDKDTGERMADMLDTYAGILSCKISQLIHVEEYDERQFRASFGDKLKQLSSGAL